jgi:hypothetical protein
MICLGSIHGRTTMSRMFIPSTGECVLVYDLDSSEADQTIRLKLDGIHYELDLSTENVQKLRDYLQPSLQVSHIVRRDDIRP